MSNVVFDIYQEKWDKRFLELAKHVAQWSKDPSTKVGAVIVDPTTKKVVSMGYNGFARGVKDTDERLNDRETKLSLVVHAELNAILQAERSVRGCDIYIWPTMMEPNCCPECAKAIAQSGIKNVFGYSSSKPLSERWQKFAEYSTITLSESGVTYRRINE